MEQTKDLIKKEIQYLEEKLAAKKREVGEESYEISKEAFAEVFRQNLDQIKNNPVSDIKEEEPPSIPKINRLDFLSPKVDPLIEVKEKTEIEHLVEVSLTRGLNEAIKLAVSTGDPYLLDTLEKELENKYYEKLVLSKQIHQD